MTVDAVLELAGVGKSYRRRGRRDRLLAVRDADLTVRRGESVALVGESGSGKSTLARLALCLERPDAGAVCFRGVDLTALSRRRLRVERQGMQPIFQDATASFNPRRPVGSALYQALTHLDGNGARRARAVELLERVGLTPGENYLARYPHELSGGQRQRLAIARAIAMEPELIIADEPLSGADVSVRGQVMNLLMDIQRERGVSYLMITHDISLARAFADRIAVMHHGEIVETGPAGAVLDTPQDDYTRRLIAAVPDLAGPMPVPAYER